MTRRPWPIRSALLAVAGAALAAACEPPPPEFVWIRDPVPPARLEISWAAPAPESLTAGRWIELHATRETGHWTRVAHRDLSPGTRWLREPPPAREAQVQNNIRWRTAPAGIAEFSIPTTQDLEARRIRFKAAGTCTLWATSHTWDGGTVTSDSIVATVLP